MAKSYLPGRVSMTPAERAREIAQRLNMCCKHSKITRCFECSIKTIAAALVEFGEAEYKRGFGEGAVMAAKQASITFRHSPRGSGGGR